MQQFGERIFVETEYLGANVTCILTQKGAVLIDSPMLKKDALKWSSIIQKMNVDIAYLINTDHHFDHVMGNEFLTNSVICHSTAAMGIKALNDKKILKEIITRTFPDLLPSIEADVDELKIPAPHITFNNSMTVDMGDAKIVLEFVGGHSPGTILIYIPEYRVAITGDNVETQFPYFGQSHFYTWKKILDKMMAMEIDILIPGHGNVGDKKLVTAYLSFFNTLEKEVKILYSKGVPVEDMSLTTNIFNEFFLEQLSNPEMKHSWLREQYVYAARQIIKNIQKQV